MFFKNAVALNLENPPSYEDILERLEQKAFSPCGMTEPSSSGWVAPHPELEELAYKSAGRILICLNQEKRLLPASVVKDALLARIESLENTKGAPLSKDEKEEAKDHVLSNLLPKAFVQSTRMYGYIDTESNRLIIDTSSAGKCDDFTELLRNTLGSLDCTFLDGLSDMQSTLTRWFVNHNDVPCNLEIQDAVDFKASEGSAAVRCKGVNIASKEVQSHVSGSGLTVQKIAMEWKERTSFSISKDGFLTGLSFFGSKEDGEGYDGDDTAQFEAEFLILSGELDTLFSDIVTAAKG